MSVEPYKGVRDFYPEDQAFLNYLFATYRSVVERWGYVEYHASVLEPAELYKSKAAENEEIINDQTYSFVDRGGREVTLRPEMTPTVARLVSARRRELGFPLRLYSIPNVFRYERPQRGRLREHWQLNVDLFGASGWVADAEVITIARDIMQAFGAKAEDYVIKVNSRRFLSELIAELGLSEERARALLLLLDRKAKMPEEDFVQSLMELGVPPGRLTGGHPPEDVAQVLDALAQLGVTNAVYAPDVVRGFNYYTGVVFEVFDLHPDNNRSLFGGGRYENLTALFDEEAIPGVGFGMGDVTIRDFLDVRGLLPAYMPPTRLYIACAGEDMAPHAASLAAELRAQGVSVAIDFGERKLSDQIKAASKHKIPWLMVVGPDELKSGTFVLRNLATGMEERRSVAELSEFFLTL